MNSGVATVREMSSADAASWTAFVSEHPAANLYHTVEWRDVIHSVFGHRPVYLIAGERGAIRGVLPLFLVRFPGLGAKLISIPYDIGSGGPLAVDEAAETALVRATLALARRLDTRLVELRCASPREALDAAGLRRSEPVLISEMALGDREKVWSRIAPDHRKAIRKAENRGITVRAADALADYSRFYDIYLHCFRAFGTPPYGARYFPELWTRLHDSGGVRLVLAEHEGRTVGGLVLFCWRRTLVSKFAACLPEAVPLRAYAAMYWRAITLGLELGAERLSWGSSSRGQTGLIEFKERWGAETRPASVYQLALKGKPPSLERYYQDGMIRRLWARLPLGATRVLGGALNRWFC